MARIESKDILYTTISQRGSIIGKLTLSGINSFSGIVHILQHSLKNVSGLITIQIRNRSQGWSENRSLILSTPSTHKSALQLSLF